MAQFAVVLLILYGLKIIQHSGLCSIAILRSFPRMPAGSNSLDLDCTR